MTSLFSPKVWPTHRRREYFDDCPHCGAPLKWVYDGVEWMPCDKEPVLFIHHPEGKSTVIYRRTAHTGCLVYARGDKRFAEAPKMGHTQHYYTCPRLISARREYIKRKARKAVE